MGYGIFCMHRTHVVGSQKECGQFLKCPEPMLLLSASQTSESNAGDLSKKHPTKLMGSYKYACRWRWCVFVSESINLTYICRGQFMSSL